MIDVDFTNVLDQVRINIGDTGTGADRLVSDNSINSALVAFNNNVTNTSIALMEMLVTKFATLADREREGQVEVYYTKLYERYKERLKDFKAGDAGGAVPSNKAFMPIIIAGTSKQQHIENAINNTDAFSMYNQSDWHNEKLGLYQEIYERPDL